MADIVIRITGTARSLIPNGQVEWVGRSAATSPWGTIEQSQGLDPKETFRDTLEGVGRRRRSAKAREHVADFLRRERPGLFLVRSATDSEDNSDLRWTVDTPEDLAMVRHLCKALALGERQLGYREIVGYFRAHPESCAVDAERER